METIFCDKARKILREKELLEKRLGVTIIVKGKQVTISGAPLEEYEAAIVFEAINFGYDVKTALLLKEEDVVFHRIPIKNFTRRKNLEEIRARLIGTHGRTKKTLEQLSDCKIIIKDTEVGVLCSSEEVEAVMTSITSLIRGTKQANAYKYLERINTQRRNPVESESSDEEESDEEESEDDFDDEDEEEYKK